MDEASQEALATAVGELAPPVLGALAMIELAQRHLHPPSIPMLAEQIVPHAQRIAEASERFAAEDWPEDLIEFRDRFLEAASLAAGACSGLGDLPADGSEFVHVLRSLRRNVRALELLYPLTAVLPPLNRWFLEREMDDDAAVAIMRQIEGAVAGGWKDNGPLHMQNGREERGGFSAYVPEWCPPGHRMPLIVALHGGSGHGRDFLWSWLREARTRCCMLVAPTSADRTWSMTGGEDTDYRAIFTIVDELRSRFPVDESRMLLTGMSDGGTYAFLSGLREESPFTALAPFSCVLAPELQMDGRLHRAKELPIWMVHGALDWMFPVQMAREASQLLQVVGADLTYRELDDLSHTYAREENTKILDWMGIAPPL